MRPEIQPELVEGWAEPSWATSMGVLGSGRGGDVSQEG